MALTDIADLSNIAANGPLPHHHLDHAAAPTPDCLVVTFADDTTGTIAYLIATGPLRVTVGSHTASDAGDAAQLLRDRGTIGPIGATTVDGRLTLTAGANAAIIAVDSDWELIDSKGRALQPLVIDLRR